jgi:hypothetical protein
LVINITIYCIRAAFTSKSSKVTPESATHCVTFPFISTCNDSYSNTQAKWGEEGHKEEVVKEKGRVSEQQRQRRRRRRTSTPSANPRTNSSMFLAGIWTALQIPTKNTKRANKATVA